MADLPRMTDHPRLVSMADNVWDCGKVYGAVDSARSFALGLRRRCYMCGYPLSTPGYLIVTEGGVADGGLSHRFYPGGLYAQGLGPIHRSCALYGAIVCPSLRYKKSRRARDNAKRGRAVLVGFSNYGNLVPPGDEPLCFGFFGVAGEYELTNLADTEARYAAAVEADAKLDFMSSPRLYWTDSPDDLQRLGAMLEEDEHHWAATDHSVTYINGHRYHLHVLMGSAHVLLRSALRGRAQLA
jgi:hypothetical protein